MDKSVAVFAPSSGSAGKLYDTNGSRKYLNCAERARLFAAIERIEPHKAAFLLTLAWTGARVTEILALSAQSFQLEERIVAVSTLKRRRHVMREVPLPTS